MVSAGLNRAVITDWTGLKTGLSWGHDKGYATWQRESARTDKYETWKHAHREEECITNTNIIPATISLFCCFLAFYKRFLFADSEREACERCRTAAIESSGSVKLFRFRLFCWVSLWPLRSDLRGHAELNVWVSNSAQKSHVHFLRKTRGSTLPDINIWTPRKYRVNLRCMKSAMR